MLLMLGTSTVLKYSDLCIYSKDYFSVVLDEVSTSITVASYRARCLLQVVVSGSGSDSHRQLESQRASCDRGRHGAADRPRVRGKRRE